MARQVDVQNSVKPPAVEVPGAEADATSGRARFASRGAIPPVAINAGKGAPTASDRAFGGVTEITAALDTTSPTVATTADGTVTDAGALGKVATSFATTGARVDLAQPAEAVVTAVDANANRSITVSATVPLSQIHANDITPEQIAQITNVTLFTGLEGTVSYRLVGDAIELTLAGISNVKEFNGTFFKLWLASGLSIALNVRAPSFHTDISEWERAGVRLQIAQEQQQIAQLREMEATASPSAAASEAGYLASDEQRLAKDQQTLASMAGAKYVMLDTQGAEIKTPAAPR